MRHTHQGGGGVSKGSSEPMGGTAREEETVVGVVGVTISGAGRRQCRPEGLPSGVNGRPGRGRGSIGACGRDGLT